MVELSRPQYHKVHKRCMLNNKGYKNTQNTVKMALPLQQWLQWLLNITLRKLPIFFTAFYVTNL
jgi:hypothetical protein